jgi:putative ABC transport system permease protein
MAGLLRDIRFGLRLLARNPGHTAIATLALGLGIGLCTAMFSIVRGTVLQGLPFERSDRLLHLETNQPSKDIDSREVPLHDFLDWQQRQKSFEGLAAFYEGTINLSGALGRETGSGEPARFEGCFISANAFGLLRARPLHGRTFLPGEDTPGAPAVVILGYQVWQDRYEGDPAVVGRSVRANGEAATVIGVMPRGFAFPINQEVWMPLRENPLEIRRGEGTTLEVFGRLRDGVGEEAAQTEMSGIAQALAAEYPATNKGIGAVVKPYTEEYIGDEAASLLYTMLGAVFFVLLIACANVASLNMARAAQRTRELAVRSALGAERRQVVTQILTESLLLSVCGALLGLVLAQLGLRAFLDALARANPPFWLRIELHPEVLLFTLVVTVISGLVAGLAPALQASRADLNEVLKDEGRGSSSLRLGRFSRVVVIAEVALSCALLVGSGLMIRSVMELRQVDLGFDPSNTLTVRIALFESAYPEPAQRVAFFDELLRRLADRPGVVAAAAATALPGGGSGGTVYALEGKAYAAQEDMPFANHVVVAPGYFGLFGARLAAGRDFGPQDTAASLPVAIVNRSFAAKAWPGTDALGRQVKLGSEPDAPWRTVVGVVPDLHMQGLDDIAEDPEDGVYVPLSQEPSSFVSVAVKTRENPLALVPLVRKEVTALDPDLPIYFVYSMDEVLANATFFPNLFSVLFAIFGACALVLAAVGIYGVMAFSVERRTQEIGIRMALGSAQSGVLRLILAQGLRQLAIGLAVGLLLAFGLSRLLANILFQVQPGDPPTFAIVALVLTAVATAACLIPARRAARVDPLVAIRNE